MEVSIKPKGVLKVRSRFLLKARFKSNLFASFGWEKPL